MIDLGDKSRRSSEGQNPARRDWRRRLRLRIAADPSALVAHLEGPKTS